MRKLEEKYENPVDNLIYKIVEYVAPIAYDFKITPNMITTIGNILAVIGIYFLYNHQVLLSIIFVILAYISDCLDGYVARKYDMVTLFGDYYDHASDIIKHTIIFYLLYVINPKLFMYFIPIIILENIGLSLYFYYQEILYDKYNDSPSIQFFISQYSHILGNSKKDANDKMKYVKYFGSGTGTLMLCIFMYMIVNNKNSKK
jgi:phosphatidylglycerophosphate synthase